jgi:hypothetical protein
MPQGKLIRTYHYSNNRNKWFEGVRNAGKNIIQRKVRIKFQSERGSVGRKNMFRRASPSERLGELTRLNWVR